MSAALTSHHTRVAGDDRAPELLVVGHAAIVERRRGPAEPTEQPYGFPRAFRDPASNLLRIQELG